MKNFFLNLNLLGAPVPHYPLSLWLLIRFHQQLEKPNRTELEKKSSISKTNNTQLDVVNKLTHTIDKLVQTVDSIDTKDHSCWDAIKEIPYLDKYSHFKALKLLNTRAKKIEFLKMAPEEHSD